MNRWLLFFLLSLTALRLFIGGQTEVSPDEAYYYQWALRPDWAYFSKGPGVAFAIKLGTTLLGPTEMGVRLLSPLLALGTSVLMYFIARRFFNASVAIWAVLFINVVPIFQAGSLVMTIDPLSIFFWTAALWTFWLALERSPKFSLFWPLTGLLMGFGFLCKYTNAMQLISVVLVLALTPRFRREFLRPGFWTLIAAFLLGGIPPIVWNARHDWITWQHLQDDGGLQEGFGIRPTEFLAFLGLHFGVYSPLIFGGMLAGLVWAYREAKTNVKVRYLLLFALPLLVLYFTLSFQRAGQPNWTAPAFVSLGILTVAFWHGLAQRARWARCYAVAALGLGAVMSLGLVHTDALRRLGVNLVHDRDPAARLRGWQTIAEAVDGVRTRIEKEEGKPLFLIAERYQTTSSLAFYLPNKRVEGPAHPPVYVTETQAITNQYAFWPRYDQMIEPVTQAQMMLPDVGDAEKRDALAVALAAVQNPKITKGSNAAAENRRMLIRALLAVDPKLPLDEYASEEIGVSQFYGRDALYLNDSGGNRIPTAIENAFEKVELVTLWQESRWGLPLRVVRLYHCRNYRSLPL